ncbi:uncharacterized protein LOC115446508 [Manduca sexta]|uniref:uncharacterized protein LOC115446508 n=1 Tax=Manduca sexta TaxID=7130 RepID=UPI00188FB50B|nr:uncharacterized protein LOC115446508 [Manduca sexta]
MSCYVCTLVFILQIVAGEIIFNVPKNKTKELILEYGIGIANDNFDFAQPTAVLHEDVDEDIVSQYLKSYRGSVTVEIAYYEPPSTQIMIFLETLESFVKIMEKMKPDLKGRSLLNSRAKFIILLLDNRGNIQRMTEILWDYHVIDVAIITSKNGNITFYTYFPYRNQEDCRNTDPVLLEYWNRKEPLRDILFPEKIKNMQACPLYISTNKLYQPDNEQKNQLQIIKNIMIDSLREVMNFTPSIFNRDYISIDSDRAKNWSDSLNDVITGLANVSTCSIPLGVDKLGLLEHSTPYFTVRLVWLAPPIKPGSAWWRLFSPLSGYLWLLILIVLSFIKGLPLTLKLPPIKKFCYRYFKNFNKLHGIIIKTWAVMMGQPIRVFPKRFRDFYILTLWMWYTFVIRNVYQSVLIGALKTDSTDGNFATLKETIENGFEFGGRAGIYTHFEFDPIIRNGFVIVQEEHFEEVFQDVIDGKVKFILSTSLEYAYAYCLAVGKKETECGHVLPDSILILPLVIWMKINSPFTKPISLWLQRLIESGLLEREKIVVNTIAGQLITDPSPLNSHQIISCMLCLVTGYAFSTVAFLFEIVRFQLHKFKLNHGNN